METEFDLPDEQVQDGLAFARLMADERVWPALQRLLAKLKEDAIVQFTDEREGATKKWLKGYRQCLDDLQARMVDSTNLATNHVENKKLVSDAARSMADEGMGVGDIA